jgi:protein gp37
VAYRFSGPGKPYEGLAVLRNGHASWTGKVEFVEEHLLDPLKWGGVKQLVPGAEGPEGQRAKAPTTMRPRRIFVNSMSDLFHENVSDEWIDKIFAVMALCPHHIFQILTKRPERMRDWALRAFTEEGGIRIGRAAASLFHGMSFKDRNLSAAEQAAVSNQFEWRELHHVWLGTSVENQVVADERIPLLLQTPAAVRFISAEPLLGPVDLTASLRIAWQCSGCRSYFSGRLQTKCPNCGRENYWTGSHQFNPPGRQVGPGLNWVICGGESGPDARPMHLDWVRSLRDQCAAAEVPFFFKQWGEWTTQIGPDSGVRPNSLPPEKVLWINPDGRTAPVGAAGDLTLGPDNLTCRVGKKAAGHMLDGREWHQFPKV